VTALSSVYADPASRDKMIDAGLQQAKKFSWENYAEETVRAYEEM
jgi:glycosyltransferase involved in cell wall biosynthesis